jgi:hypothetical protein
MYYIYKTWNEIVQVRYTTHNSVVPFYKLTDVTLNWHQRFHGVTDFWASLYDKKQW